MLDEDHAAAALSDPCGEAVDSRDDGSQVVLRRPLEKTLLHVDHQKDFQADLAFSFNPSRGQLQTARS